MKPLKPRNTTKKCLIVFERNIENMEKNAQGNFTKTPVPALIIFIASWNASFLPLKFYMIKKTLLTRFAVLMKKKCTIENTLFYFDTNIFTLANTPSLM